ncbi:hypothetical protein HYW20_00100 [Candidatus Woesearchaeota archaeon]|nr:hypothetical protein [Candidatus Woesearchaeota archaeon]
MIDKPTAKKIGFYAVAFLIISSLSIMAFINLSGKYDSITGFAAKDKETTNDTNEKPNITTDGIAPTADAAPETAAEIPAANETAAEDENQEKTKKEKNEKNNPPVWKSDVDEFILKGKTVIDLGSYFYDEENDTLAYLFTEPENVAVDIDGSVVTLTPAKYNITTSMTFTATDGEKATSKEIALIVPEKTITGILEYKSGSAYDADNDGYEATTGIIDLTVESSEFSWDADETKLCTRWQTTSIEDGKITTVCYGSAKCCNFIGLEPARDKWNEVFYSTYGQYGAALNNTISAQTIYVDYALNAEEPFAEIYYSGWGELGARYYLAAIDFKNVCVETCTLSGFNDTSYRLIFEIDNAVLSLDTITYSIVEEIKNVIVSLGVEDNEGAESGSYQLYRNNTPINVTEGGVEPDYYDIEVLPAENADAMDKLLIQNADITKPVTASIGIDNVGREITIENVDVTKRYAVNLEEIDFENAVLTATATANSLYKCRQWDFDSEVCFGSWEKIKDLAVGQQYELTLTKDDPGFIEGNVNITTLNLTGLALIKDIPNISINVNSNAVINLSDYFSDIDENTLFTYFEQDGISIVFDKDIATIAADKDIDGVRFTFITANDSGNLAVSNVFAVTISAGQTNASDLRFNFDDEETNITYYMEADGEKIKANYKGALKENRKFGFVFDEKEVEDEIRAKKQKSFDKKIFYEISSSEDYAKSLANPYMLERALEGQFREVVNQIGQTEIRQVKRFLSFEDVFGKEANKGKNGYLSFAKKGKKWVVEFYNLFDLDPSFIDDTDTNWNSGTFRNMFTTGTGTTANLSALNVSGHYGSQIFDGTAVSNWTNITVTLEANYEMEIGRAYNDSNNAKLPYINTSGLVGLWYFNNESGYGENDSLVRDFSPDVNVERAGSARNNGTAFNGTRINKTDYKLGSGAGWFDGVDDYVIMPASGSLGQVYLTLPTWTYSAWIYPRGLGESSFGRIFSIRINGQSATESRVLRLGSTGEFVFTTSMTCTGATATSASNKVLLNTWQFITATFEMPDNNGAGKIFQNGVEIASGTGTCNINSDTDEAFIIGNRIAGDRNFNGSIDEVAIWNRTLSASEIQNLYKRGAYRLNLSVRSCDDSVCSGEAYTQVENFTRGNIQNLTYLNLPNNRYFQYNFTYSNSSAYGVKLNIENVSIDYFISQDFNFTKLVNTTDRVEVPFNNGNFSNTRFNYSIGAIQSNKDSTGITLNGTYQSQVFDLGTTQQFYNISWTEGAYYGEEIGRCVAEDSLITVVDSVIVYDRNNDENKEKRGSQNWQTAAETAASPRDLSNRESLYINVSVPILGKAEVPELADGAVSKTAASPRGVGVRTLRDEIPLLSTQKYNSNYSILSINEFIECQEKNGCKEFTYITSKKKIKDIQEGDYVQSLDEKTGKIVANRVNELVDMGNKTVYELRTESGRSIFRL